MKDELRTPQVLRKLGEMRSAGKSWTSIKKELEFQHGIHASVPTIQHAYDVYATRSAEIIAGDENLKNSLKEAVLNTAKQLEEINTVMRDIVKEAKEKPEMRIAASREVLNQLYFQEKLLNRIERGFNTTKINKIEYTKVSINNLEELEKAGYIKILKRPGEIIDLEQREVEVEDGNNNNNPEEQTEGDSGGVRDSKERKTEAILSGASVSEEDKEE